MQQIIKEQISELLIKITDILDIPDYLHEDAVLKYEDIGAWLASNDSELRDYSPEIYPQGSFRLGTVIRPISDAGEYDIDLVCHLRIDKERTTQDELKQMVGDRLEKRDDISEILDESRRCWCLNYPGQFHMDVLPAIPNSERPPTGILLTDTDLVRWQKSNPVAYADWFYDQMKVILEEKRIEFAESIQASVEDVPEWQVKTPLQRVVQLLKRHRDIYFQNDQENKPVSIIITTLAARAYRNQANLFAAVSDITQNMAQYIENRNGIWWIANPVDPDENFGDKWNEKPERRVAFFEWLQNVQEDFEHALQEHTFQEASYSLRPAFGENTVLRAASSVGLVSASVPAVIINEAAQVPALADSRHCQFPQWPERINYTATIKGTVHRSLYHPKKLWSLTDRSVPKDVGLRFVVSTNVPKPYEVKWQIVNTGSDALKAGQLRGDFYSCDRSTDNVRWESTSYVGTHWVEAFIIKNGICVARSGRKYVRVRQ